MEPSGPTADPAPAAAQPHMGVWLKDNSVFKAPLAVGNTGNAAELWFPTCCPGPAGTNAFTHHLPAGGGFHKPGHRVAKGPRPR